MNRRWQRSRVPLVITLLLVAARLAGAPPLSDPVHAVPPESLFLSVPVPYLLLAPIFTLWDGISMLSMSRLRGLLLGLAAVYLLWRVIRTLRRSRKQNIARAIFRELGVLLLSTVLLLGFLLAGALWHRPMLSLGGVSPGDKVVDFHSHTRASHDVGGTLMDGFDAAANRHWHTRAGFDAAFVTDHNIARRQTPDARRQATSPALMGRETPDARRQSAGANRRLAAEETETVLCPGIEVSAWKAHIVLLGDTLPVDRGAYNGSLEELLDLLQTSEARFGAPTVASLPEYRRNHWHRLDTLMAAGLDGFEIVNASPKANELTVAERDSVISLARSGDRFVVGVSDSHGWGATSMVWNLVRVPQGTQPSGLCAAIMKRLGDGFSGARVVERHRLRADSWWPVWLTPFGVVWETWRSMDWPLTTSWVLWVWLLWGAATLISRLRRKAWRANIASDRTS